jgi:hypothetical protein
MPRDPVQPLSAGHARAALRAALRAGLAAGVALALLAPAAGAEGRLQKFRGHLGVGYAKLVGDPSPAGSFAMGVGVDYPLAERWRLGLDFGYELLGGDIAERGSFVSGIDYSMIEILAMAHWAPEHLWWLRRVSVGPGLFGAHADLAVSAGGLSFSDLAVDEFAPGLALDGTFMQAHEAAVRVGLELGGRIAFLSEDTWTMGLVRVAFHY